MFISLQCDIVSVCSVLKIRLYTIGPSISIKFFAYEESFCTNMHFTVNSRKKAKFIKYSK